MAMEVSSFRLISKALSLHYLKEKPSLFIIPLYLYRGVSSFNCDFVCLFVSSLILHFLPPHIYFLRNLQQSLV